MKVLIVSLGKTTEPVVKSIHEHEPGLVCFFASQTSVDNVHVVKKALREAGVQIVDHKIIVDDHEDMLHCYEKACTAFDHVRDKGIEPECTYVDFTGGTKAMTAALALAGAGYGCRFSYVGGSSRENATGRVVSGTEIVKHAVSPLDLFAVEQKKLVALHFNSYQFSAVREVIDGISEHTTLRQETIFPLLHSLSQAYQDWDDFRHKNAGETLPELSKKLSVAAKSSEDQNLIGFAKGVEDSLQILQQIQENTRGFQKLHLDLVCDLITNANRRAKEHRFDDALARLYRALEMIGQFHFEAEFGCPTSEVPPEKIPESLQVEYVRRYSSRKGGKLQLPLLATFEVLAAAGCEAANVFARNEQEFKRILQARNHSILAHGQNPVKPTTYTKLRELMTDSFHLNVQAVFPKLPPRW